MASRRTRDQPHGIIEFFVFFSNSKRFENNFICTDDDEDRDRSSSKRRTY